MPILKLLATNLIVIFGATLISPITTTTSAPTPDQVVCLTYGDNKSVWLLNPRTGEITAVQDPNYIGGSRSEAPSPAGGYSAISYDRDPNGEKGYSLAVRDEKTGRITRISEHNVFSDLWSPDGTYLVYVWGNQGRAAVTVVKPNGTVVRSIDTAFLPKQIDLQDWSSDGTYILFQVQSEPNSYSVGFLSTPTWQWTQYSIKRVWIGLNNNATHQWFVQLERNSGYALVTPQGITDIPIDQAYSMSVHPVWSPTGRYLALLYLSYTDSPPDPRDVQHYTIFDTSENRLTKVAEITASQGMELLNKLWWSADEQAVIYLQMPQQSTQDKPPAQLMSYRIRHKRAETLATNVLSNVLLPLDKNAANKGITELLVSSRQSDSSTKVERINVSNKQRISLFDTAETVENIDLSPDEKNFALTTSKGDRYTMHLLQNDGNKLLTMSHDLISGIYHRIWAVNGKWFVYEIRYIARGAAEDRPHSLVVNLQTRQAVELPGRAEESPPTKETDVLNVVSRTRDGLYGVIGYTLDGQRKYSFQSLSTTTGNHPRYKTYYYIAPDHHAAILTFGALGVNTAGNDSLLFALADSSTPRVLEPDLYQVAYVLWSPDSSMVAITYLDSNKRPALRVLDHKGADLYYMDRFEVFPDLAEWVTCKPSAE